MKKPVSILVITLLLLGNVFQTTTKANREVSPNAGTAFTQEQMDHHSNGKVVKLVETLYVYPEDLGTATENEASEICDKINAQKSYGHNDWRLPSPDELSMIYRNKDKIVGLVNEYYLSGAIYINEWGERIGVAVLHMKLGNNKWCRAAGECEDYMPLNEKARIRLVRGNMK